MSMTDPATLKNDTQRKEWLANYKDWGLWYLDEHIDVAYYKYDFRNGARLIVEEHVAPESRYLPAHTQPYYHLVGGPEPAFNKWLRHEAYEHYADSETYLVNFLKATKGGAT